MTEAQRSEVLAEGCFTDVGRAAILGYTCYEVILYPVMEGLTMQRCPFYAVSDEAAVRHCREVYASLRFRLYRLTPLDTKGS